MPFCYTVEELNSYFYQSAYDKTGFVISRVA